LRYDRVRLGIVKLHKQIARPDPLTLDNPDRHHASRSLRGNLDTCHNPYSPAGDHVLLDIGPRRKDR
jgi:hypothetical protein